ncbi:GPCR, rhodopsin-like, 7TM domain and 7TM GPCR,olfactory receptor/chemoreceptor Srsx family-containing protein [Strongyloides ratti]|uniref:GPCR, rhodopsin-like, 7TM domain and 7TM GPCR,olfactory receptor/chemoreceptor Srsx family-containing protein n=1 Tax=Strongyloides ratti TaxID=34506 RepID=A0A090KTW0_STRRB|nr:GPCR, rhodopsin-like, 7TM domain and 7TM GPCR,olfactory receptor/chemoreceptor Srsx family-containing protein [Strongyloides ratti]CEF60960.1 GPCR, rhodopsin-like, 7TM domain and 7TM GPCR,olfactory receptor/chemoreceptor Srsx family-containing protein [Strongyloides ratti]
MLDIDDSKDSENCNIHSFIGKAYEYYFMGILLILIGISTPIFIFEISVFYNLLLFLAGLLMVITNIIYIYIIVKFNLTKISIQYVLARNLSTESILLGLHHIIIPIINLIIINPNLTLYNSMLCRIRSITEIFLLYLFEVSFALRVITFIIMLNYPVIYHNIIDHNKKGKFIIFPVIIIAILATSFFTIDSFSITQFKICTFYSAFGKVYETFFIGLIGFIVILTIPVLYLGSIAINKMKTEGSYKNSVIQLLNYEITVFTGCWFIPNMFIFIFYFINIKKDQMGMLYDISSLVLSISGIVEFPFTIWKNRDVKNCFYKIIGKKSNVVINGNGFKKKTNICIKFPSTINTDNKFLNK